jgi:hypothetical protein
VRVCTPPQAGIFGTSVPVDDEDLVGGEEATIDADEDEIDYDADDLEGEFYPDVAAENRKAGKKAVKIKNKIGTLPVAEVLPKLVAKDVARPAGVYEETGTYDAVVDDFDGDGVDDLFIGRHGKKGLLLLNRSGVFTPHEALDMDPVDRHGCTAADVDGSGLPDLYCAAGGKRGSGAASRRRSTSWSPIRRPAWTVCPPCHACTGPRTTARSRARPRPASPRVSVLERCRMSTSTATVARTS